jgi:formate hydrogenlyase transcriptional activator
VLEHGDELRVGRTTFQFFIEEAPEQTGSTRIHVDESEGNDHRETIELDLSDSVFLQPLTEQTAMLRRLTEDMRVLLRLGGELNEIDDSGELQQRILERLFEIVPADAGAIIPVSSKNELILRAAVCRRRTEEKREIAISRTITNSVLSSGRSLLSNHLQDDAAAAPSIISAHIQSVLCVPLTFRATRIGVIYLNTTSRQDFDQRHLELLTAIGSLAAIALEHLRYVEWLEEQNQQLQHEVAVRHDMIGRSPQMTALYEKISRVAPTDSKVLILGETGTGKELAARAIHNNSGRRGGPFIAVNIAAVPEGLFESELFGHMKGAFNGADRDRAGYIEAAHGGTLFLDEIGDLPVHLQSKLLRVIEDQKVNRLGGTEAKGVDIRLISATSRSVTDDGAAERFRKDLLHRLGVRLLMPPLRERLEDIPLLVAFFLDVHRHRAQRELGATPPETIRILQEYDWPGNVRELGVALESAVLFGKSDRIRPEDLPPEILRHAASGADSPGKLDTAKESYERQLILRALEETRGVVTEAALILDRVPTYLQRRITRLGLRNELNRIRRES